VSAKSGFLARSRKFLSTLQSLNEYAGSSRRRFAKRTRAMSYLEALTSVVPKRSRTSELDWVFCNSPRPSDSKSRRKDSMALQTGSSPAFGGRGSMPRFSASHPPRVKHNLRSCNTSVASREECRGEAQAQQPLLLSPQRLWSPSTKVTLHPRSQSKGITRRDCTGGEGTTRSTTVGTRSSQVILSSFGVRPTSGADSNGC
jgi:hypothetical protein